MHYNRFQQWMNLSALLKYGFLVAGILTYLPLTAFEWMLGHGVVGGIFIELGNFEVYLTSLALAGAWWSLMFTEGLIVDGVEARLKSNGTVSSRDHHTDYLPKRAKGFFGFPVSLDQFIVYTALGVSGISIIVWKADSVFWAGLSSVAGILTAYIFMLILCLPAVARYPGDPPLPFFWKNGDREEKLDQGKKFEQYKFFALSNFLLLLLVLGIVMLLFSPSIGLWKKYEAWEPPAAAYLLVMFMLLIWIIGALKFYLSPVRISPLAAVIVFMILSYNIWGVDHYYVVEVVKPKKVVDSKKDGGKLLPHEVVIVEENKAKPDKKGTKKNLVIVTASGGGIWAAGWLAQGLKSLINARPELKDEIRLLSGISGGAVATAFYVDGMLRYANKRPKPSPKRCQRKNKLSVQSNLDLILHRVFENAVCSSLSVTGYGFAYLDFWRFVTGGILPRSRNDRGTLLEEKWARTAAGMWVERKDHYKLLELREHIKNGLIPAFILGATVNETGRRVMITPIDFSKSEPNKENKPGKARGDTLWEYLRLVAKKDDKGKKGNAKCTDPKKCSLQELLESGTKVPDMSLWTAARLSATFSYVSPSARMELWAPKEQKRERPNPKQKKGKRRAHHIIDGGYYDNYGVTSALDWLDLVLHERVNGKLKNAFDRVLIIELRSSPEKEPGEVEPSQGWKSALLGPVAGILSIRDAAAKTRNEIDVVRFMSSWENRFKKKGDHVCFKRLVFQPKSKDKDGKENRVPLSWHLTSRQIDRLEDEWNRALVYEIDNQQKNKIKDMNDFLKPDCKTEEKKEKGKEAQAGGTSKK